MMKKIFILILIVFCFSKFDFAQSSNLKYSFFPIPHDSGILSSAIVHGEKSILIPLNLDTINNNNSIIGRYSMNKITILNHKELKNILQSLSDSANFADTTLIKSCSFVPNVLIKLETKGKINKNIFIVISTYCSQIAIVSEDLKQIFYFGDLSSEGLDLFEKYKQ